ncbi:MAG: hypothetical protein IPL99_15580 [Candidatus Competibacteraceae bacterium]|nr:hypothetical protein [Candidatus Competibacteraceae bacterium]
MKGLKEIDGMAVMIRLANEMNISLEYLLYGTGVAKGIAAVTNNRDNAPVIHPETEKNHESNA